MCGRYQRRSDKQRLAEAFRLGHIPDFPLPPDFNVAPTTFQPVIRLNRDTNEREMVLMRWGMIPYFTESLAQTKRLSTINARAENITAGIWKRVFERHRCLVPVDAFYEWQTLLPSALSGPPPKRKPKPVKKPYSFSMLDNAPFALAGVWDAWHDPAQNEWLQSFAIVTTEANDLLSSIHTRMPVILEPQNYARWLDRTPNQPLPLDLLRPYDPDRMQQQEANLSSATTPGAPP